MNSVYCEVINSIKRTIKNSRNLTPLPQIYNTSLEQTYEDETLFCYQAFVKFCGFCGRFVNEDVCICKCLYTKKEIQIHSGKCYTSCMIIDVNQNVQRTLLCLRGII